MDNKCPLCKKIISHVAVKKITSEIIGLNYGSNETLIEEKIIFICPQCQGTIYVKKDDDEGKLTEIAKRVWQSLSLKK